MQRLILLAISLAFAAGCSNPSSNVKSSPKTEITSAKEPCIYVDGEVRNPGKIAWTNGMTLQDAIQSAGGFTEFSPSHLRVTHEGVTTGYRLGPGRTFTNNPPVQPGDKIYSPRRIF